MPDNPTRTDYDFLGWNTESDGDGTRFTDETIVRADITVYAEWDEDNDPRPNPDPTYTVTFEDYDGTTIKRDRVNPGRDANPPGDPTRTGFEFKGWEGNWRNVRKNETVVALYEEIVIEEIIIEEPITEAPPVVIPPVEVVEVPVEVPAAAPTLPKTGSVGAGEMAGFGALMMAIGILLGKKKGF